MYKVKSCAKTCDAFPAQWEGRTTNGMCFYIRFRFGFFRATVAENDDAAVCGGINYQGYLDSTTWESDDPLLGEMSTAEMIKLTRGMLDFSNCTVEDDEPNFFVFELSPDQVQAANPSIDLATGDTVITTLADKPVEITADKERAIVDPNRMLVDMSNMQDSLDNYFAKKNSH